MENNKILWIIGIILLLLVLTQTNLLKKQDKEVQSGIIATYYDANGNQINFQPYNYEEAMKQTPNLQQSEIFSIDKFLNPCTDCIDKNDVTIPVLPTSNSGRGSGGG